MLWYRLKVDSWLYPSVSTSLKLNGKFNLPLELKICNYKCNIKCMEKCSLDNQFVLKSIYEANIFIFLISEVNEPHEVVSNNK